MEGVQLPKVLDDLGFERTRRAVAALALCLFVVLYAFLALMLDASWKPAFAGLAACYLVAFLGLAAEWFWGRWFASGLAWSGVMVSALSLAMMGWAWPLAIYGGLHALVVFLLVGKRMTALYDLQEAWRVRYKMDEHGVVPPITTYIEA